MSRRTWVRVRGLQTVAEHGEGGVDSLLARRFVSWLVGFCSHEADQLIEVFVAGRQNDPLTRSSGAEDETFAVAVQGPQVFATRPPLRR
jgi:hypothetical protein